MLRRWSLQSALVLSLASGLVATGWVVAQDKGKAKDKAEKKQTKDESGDKGAAGENPALSKLKKDIDRQFPKRPEGTWLYITTEITYEKADAPPLGVANNAQGPIARPGGKQYPNQPRPNPAQLKQQKQQMQQQLMQQQQQQQQQQAAKATGGHGAPPGWDAIAKRKAVMVDNREAGIEDVFKFMAENMPTDSHKKKRVKGSVSEEPQPQRTWKFVKHYPKGRQSDTQAKMDHEKLEKQFEKEDRAAAWKRKKQ